MSVEVTELNTTVVVEADESVSIIEVGVQGPEGVAGNGSDATATTKGGIKLAGDLGGTADAPTVPGLASKANTSSLATVATTGSYTDLTNKPTIPIIPVTSVAGKTGAVTLTKADVGLGSVDNTSDAAKPVSTAQAAAIAAKEPTITAGTTGQYYRGDKTFQTLDKTAVGLGNVDNTSDANKPVSTATATALATKATTTHTHAESDVTNLVSDLAAKQATLVSGTNIKTINSTSLLGSGDIAISGGGGTWGSITGTLSSQSDLNTALGLKAATTYVDTQNALKVAKGSIAANVRDYGAVGDGVTDDTAAFTAWWNAIKTGGKSGYIPDGHYLTTGVVLNGGSGFTIRASRGSYIWTSKSTTAAPNLGMHNVVTVIDCTDFTIDGLSVDGRRDMIAKDQYLTATASSGATTITVQDGTDYVVGEMVSIMGGATANGGNDLHKNDLFRHITAITGNVLTITGALSQTYTATGAAGGAYVTRYQTGDAGLYTVAGRSLGNEDAQNGIHLIACSRFQLRNCVSCNIWESPIRLGVGTSTNDPNDGCFDGIVTGNECYHGYDQGIAVWLCKRLTISNNNCRDAGWAGISLTHSDECTVTGNVCTGNIYTPASDPDQGVGIALEGAVSCTVTGNIAYNNNINGIRLGPSPVYGGSGFNKGVSGTPAAGATSLAVVSSDVAFVVGSSFTIVDAVNPIKRETIFLTAVSGTSLTLLTGLTNSYATGSTIFARYGQENLISSNVASYNQHGAGIVADNQTGLRIFANDCSNNGTTALYSAGYRGMKGIHIHENCEGTTVEANTTNFNIQEGIHVENHCRSVAVVGNTANKNGVPGFNTAMGIKLSGLTDGQISNNITSYNSHSGIYTENGNGQTTRLQISNNTMLYNAQAGLWLDNGGLAVTVSGNQVGYSGDAGMKILGYSNCIFTGNQVYNTQGQEGIRFDDNGAFYCLNNIISQNALFDDQASHTQSNGFKEFGNSANTTFINNILYGNSSNTPVLMSTSNTGISDGGSA